MPDWPSNTNIKDFNFCVEKKLQMNKAQDRICKWFISTDETIFPQEIWR